MIDCLQFMKKFKRFIFKVFKDQIQHYFFIKFINQIRFMSDNKSNRTAEEIEALLVKEEGQMQQHQKNGNYVQAENSRLKIQQLKKDHEDRQLYEVEQRHKKESADLLKAHEQEIYNFENLWNKKLNDLIAEGEKSQKDLATKHEADVNKTRHQMDQQLPSKVKESSECLNLRKMQEYMVKQKNFAEAHKVQQTIFEMERKQKQSWLENKNIKIQTALSTLKTKQAAEMVNLKKRIKTLIDEQNREKIIEEQRLKQKYANSAQFLKSQQDKEIINLKGQFKSKGGSGSPMRTKSILGSTH